MLTHYELGHKLDKNGKLGTLESKVGRDLLFIERNLDFLKPGGRMAVVLPQGRFNNASDKRVRDFIAERCRILAVVGLHPNTFKPHTGTKTSVLFVQKWNDDPTQGALCPKVDDYPIFFATQQVASKDNSGEKNLVAHEYILQAEPNANGEYEFVIYSRADFFAKYGSLDRATVYQSLEFGTMNLEQLKSQYDSEQLALMLQNSTNLTTPIERKELLRDDHGHWVVEHDLFNHEGLTQDGIAEAFIEFAKKEGLSFF